MVRFTVALFDDSELDQRVSELLASADVRVKEYRGVLHRQTPAGMIADLRRSKANVVLWDLSPALSAYCHELERLLDARVFESCGLVVSSTGSTRVREYFGSRCAEMTIVDKPYTGGSLLEALSHAAKKHPVVPHGAPRWSSLGREPHGR